MNYITLESGSAISEEEISEFSNYIIRKFAEERLSVEVACLVLEATKDKIAANSQVVDYKFFNNSSCNE